MLAKVNTVDTGQQTENLSVSSYWQGPEFEASRTFVVREGKRIYHPQLVKFIVSYDIHLPTPDIANETVLTFFEEELSFLNVSYRNREVETYLARHPEIEDFIQTAWPALVECFEGPVDIVLEVITYPDEIGHEELVGWIQSTDDVDKGLEKLERFEDEWFLDHMAEVDNKFNFNIETK
jgi:hypothetical protein